MQSIFLVILSGGSYDDSYTRNLRAFGEKERAEQFAQEETERLWILKGIMQASYTLLGVWEKEHPSPWDGVSIEDQTQPSREVLDAYYAARTAECERLDKLLGLTEVQTRCHGDMDEKFIIRVEEIPFGECPLIVD